MWHRTQVFKDFFVNEYLPAHSHMGTKLLHAMGLGVAYFVGICAFLTEQYEYLYTMPVVGYGFAFSGHFWVEHNLPKTLKHPLMSFFGDHVMVFMLLTGRFKNK